MKKIQSKQVNNEHTLTDEGYMENALSASITGEILTDQEKLHLFSQNLS